MSEIGELKLFKLNSIFLYIIAREIECSYLAEIFLESVTSQTKLRVLHHKFYFACKAFDFATEPVLSEYYDVKARFHYERGKEHSFSLLLIFN